MTWTADRTCAGGKVSSSSHAIAGTSADALFQRQRVGVTSCKIPVTAGRTYDVELRLAEVQYTAKGKRVFDVRAEGVDAIRGLDIFTRAGAADSATNVTFAVVAKDSTLDLAFVPTAGLAKVSAIQLTDVTAAQTTTTSTPTPTPTPTATPTWAPAPSLTTAAYPTPYPTPAPSPTPSYTLDSSFDRPSKSDPDDYRQHVDFNVACAVARVATDDPIVFPGQPGAAHSHVFVGNTSANASSNQASLEAGTSNCLLDRDKASYWMPQLYAENGTPLVPYQTRAYYRAATLAKVSHVPRGLRMIAGDAKATVPQDKSIAGWQCRNVSPDTVAIGKQATIPTCAADDLLEGSVVFPNCWDGKYLDSADHKSHMSYGSGDTCDAAHPLRLPQLTLAYRYRPGTTNSKAYLASGASGLTLHADFWNAWSQQTLDALVDRCINSGVHCGDVDPDHFPGPIPAP